MRELGGSSFLGASLFTGLAWGLWHTPLVLQGRAYPQHPALKTDILSSGILDFGTVRSVFTVATQTHPSQRVDAIGSGGQLTIHLPFNAYPDVPLQVTVSTGVGTRNIVSPVSDQYVEMFEAFSRAVREGGSVPTPPQDAIANMKVLDALFRSEKSGS